MPTSNTKQFLPLLNYTQIRTKTSTFTKQTMRSLYYKIQNKHHQIQRTQNVLKNNNQNKPNTKPTVPNSKPKYNKQ